MNRSALAFSLALAALPVGAPAETAPDTPAQTEAVLPAIQVTEVRTDVVRDRIFGTGLIGPVDQIYVQPQVEGQAIEEILAEVGDTVAAGQVLARLSGSALALQESQLNASRAAAEAAIAQAEAQRVEAQATFDEAQRVYERTAALREQGTASQAQADQAEASATSARARVTVAEQGLSSAQAQLELVDAQIADVELQQSRTQIKAPVAGRIVARNAQIGAIATAGAQPLFVIDRDGQLELRADLAEQDVLRLAAGMPATLKVVGLAQPLTGKVRLVEPTVDTASRLGRVRIAIDPGATVVSGLFAEAEIIAAEREALTVPVTAVSTGAEGASVLKVDADGRVSRVAVKTGIRDGGVIEIVEGLSPGDRVVARAGAFVRDGDRVKPVLLTADASN